MWAEVWLTVAIEGLLVLENTLSEPPRSATVRVGGRNLFPSCDVSYRSNLDLSAFEQDLYVWFTRVVDYVNEGIDGDPDVFVLDG